MRIWRRDSHNKEDEEKSLFLLSVTDQTNKELNIGINSSDEETL